MGTIGFPNFGFSLKSSKQNLPAPHSVVAATKTDSDSEENVRVLRRRSAITYGVSLVSSAILGFPKEGLCAVKQGLLAGRIPGLSEPNEQDWTRNRLHPGLLHGLGIETSRREQVMRFKAGEDSLRRSDLGYTIIRPGPLMEEARGQRALVFYQGNRISQGIICADVADICVKTLHDSTARNKSFDVLNTVQVVITPHAYLELQEWELTQSDLENTKKEENSYLVLISLHGLIHGENMRVRLGFWYGRPVGNELQVPDCVDYSMENLLRLSDPNYIPTKGFLWDNFQTERPRMLTAI